jgi:hypothetical protein
VTPTGSAALPWPRYGAGCWAAGEVTSLPNWPAGGRLVPNVQVDFAAGLFAAAGVTGDPVTTPGPVTMTPWGDMLYDQANLIQPGLSFCYHYFGGPVAVLDGLLTITWPGTGGLAVMTSRPT